MWSPISISMERLSGLGTHSRKSLLYDLKQTLLRVLIILQYPINYNDNELSFHISHVDEIRCNVFYYIFIELNK